MKRHLIRPVRILLIFIRGSGHDRTADSLRNIISGAQDDTVKVKLLLQLSGYYLDSAPEEAKHYGINALELAQRLKYSHGTALALKNIGAAYYFLGNTPATLDYYGQALQLYDSIGDLVGKAKILKILVPFTI